MLRVGDLSAGDEFILDPSQYPRTIWQVRCFTHRPNQGRQPLFSGVYHPPLSVLACCEEEGCLYEFDNASLIRAMPISQELKRRVLFVPDTFLIEGDQGQWPGWCQSMRAPENGCWCNPLFTPEVAVQILLYFDEGWKIDDHQTIRLNIRPGDDDPEGGVSPLIDVWTEKGPVRGYQIGRNYWEWITGEPD